MVLVVTWYLSRKRLSWLSALCGSLQIDFGKSRIDKTCWSPLRSSSVVAWTGWLAVRSSLSLVTVVMYDESMPPDQPVRSRLKGRQRPKLVSRTTKPWLEKTRGDERRVNLYYAMLEQLPSDLRLALWASLIHSSLSS